MRRHLNRPVLVSLVLLALLLPVAHGASGDASPRRTVQHAPLTWHAQSGDTGAVGPRATATLIRRPDGIRYRMRATDLTPGNAYSVWFVVVNDPASCAESPYTAPQLIGDPAVDAQVTWGEAGTIASPSGTARFRARIEARPLLDGWLAVQGLDDPMGAEIHLVLNDHGPLIEDRREEMVSTYRGGCADDSPFPPFFPETALNDGEPGPNTCRLMQTAVFEPPVAD